MQSFTRTRKECNGHVQRNPARSLNRGKPGKIQVESRRGGEEWKEVGGGAMTVSPWKIREWTDRVESLGKQGHIAT